jgi:Family of unknown function (DUF6364)
MDTKLTLKLDQEVIERAKLYAHSRGVSLSRVVETYLFGLTCEEKPGERKLTGVVAELAGLLADQELDTSKEGYAEYLTHKYS